MKNLQLGHPCCALAVLEGDIVRAQCIKDLSNVLEVVLLFNPVCNRRSVKENNMYDA